MTVSRHTEFFYGGVFVSVALFSGHCESPTDLASYILYFVSEYSNWVQILWVSSVISVCRMNARDSQCDSTPTKSEHSFPVEALVERDSRSLINVSCVEERLKSSCSLETVLDLPDPECVPLPRFYNGGRRSNRTQADVDILSRRRGNVAVTQAKESFLFYCTWGPDLSSDVIVVPDAEDLRISNRKWRWMMMTYDKELKRFLTEHSSVICL